jgi:hypothetical protein
MRRIIQFSGRIERAQSQSTLIILLISFIFLLKNFILYVLSILLNMAATSYDGTCKKCGSDLSVWIEVRVNVEGVPKPEVWCIDCVRGNK